MAGGLDNERDKRRASLSTQDFRMRMGGWLDGERGVVCSRSRVVRKRSESSAELVADGRGGGQHTRRRPPSVREMELLDWEGRRKRALSEASTSLRLTMDGIKMQVAMKQQVRLVGGAARAGNTEKARLRAWTSKPIQPISGQFGR
ncbi:uncharacterized protein SPSK_10376 [Sporothrix schenckii 1099-18]|uniref:Uncharacterized protein n=1 Tax=Sporothrix schenckii 1099-18 TaxID=1397361 RepID=A0A0F2LXK9_SPOSC|nr:uncharacterized protein SPSK_10376 [Sporothrix schenckii 1099-18]KJR81230.1 hypothetical protein SPSK_10376 [Sporothrix schenckii 1099-18]